MSVQGKISSVNISSSKGEKKTPVSEIVLEAGLGVVGDAHAGGIRQVSLLAAESIGKSAEVGLELKPGDFGENITTDGIDLTSAGVGQRFGIGDEVIIQISEKGKTCTKPCSIGERLGDCIMPRDGVFAKVVRGGYVRPGDVIEETSVKAAAVVTLSDRCVSGERRDESGPVLVDMLRGMEVEVCHYSVLPDEESMLRDRLIFLCDNCVVDLILTTGGTGFSIRDRTPEATMSVLTSPAPGFAEAIRHEGLQFTPNACISRGVSGLRGRTLIVNLPGSKRAVSQVAGFLTGALPHAIESLRMEVRDCGTIPQPG